MIHHVTFCSSTMTRSAEICSRSALEFGCDSSWVVHYDDLKSTEFYWDNLDILTQERGAGYWLWKPYIILRVMQQAEHGDVVVYTDAGITFRHDIAMLFKYMDEDVFLFGNGHEHRLV